MSHEFRVYLGVPNARLLDCNVIMFLDHMCRKSAPYDVTATLPNLSINYATFFSYRITLLITIMKVEFPVLCYIHRGSGGQAMKKV